MSSTLLEAQTPAAGQGTRWMVMLYNDDITTFEDVIQILMIATACDLQEAQIEAWEAHTYGKAPVHFASKGECGSVAETISTIGVKTEVLPEWQD